MQAALLTCVAREYGLVVRACQQLHLLHSLPSYGFPIPSPHTPSARQVQECGLWPLPSRVLFRAALSAHGPIRHPAHEHSEDLLPEMRRHLLPPIQIPRQYPPLCRSTLSVTHAEKSMLQIACAAASGMCCRVKGGCKLAMWPNAWHVPP